MTSLTPKEKDRIMNDLVIKLKEERLQKDEAKQLRSILEEKKQEAVNVGDFALAMAVTFLLAGLVGYLFENVDISENTGKIGEWLGVKRFKKRS